jgi:hypothetical protein
MIAVAIFESTTEPWMLGKIIGSFFWGSLWLRSGKKKMAEEQMIKQLKARGFDVKDDADLIRENQQRKFEYMNCKDCRFFVNSKCTRKPAPTIDDGYCLSFEVGQTPQRPT